MPAAPRDRRPKTPGQILRGRFLDPRGMTQKEAAKRLMMSYPRLNEIVNGKRTVTMDTALRLARFTSTEPEYWLGLQQAVDLWDATHNIAILELDDIQPIVRPLDLGNWWPAETVPDRTEPR